MDHRRAGIGLRLPNRWIDGGREPRRRPGRQVDDRRPDPYGDAGGSVGATPTDAARTDSTAYATACAAPAPEPPNEIHLSGTISAVSGRCQVISFSLSGRSVVTNDETKYKHGKCSDLSNGDEVSLDGRPHSTGVVDATDIDIKKNK